MEVGRWQFVKRLTNVVTRAPCLGMNAKDQRAAAAAAAKGCKVRKQKTDMPLERPIRVAVN